MSSEQLDKLRNAVQSGMSNLDLSVIGKIIPRKIIPPVYFLLALIMMGLLARYAPMSHLIYIPLRVFGGLLILAGFAITASSAYTFKLAGTPVKPFEEPIKLVTDELYRFSRNPMYLGMMIMLAGIWIMLGKLSPVIVIPVFFLIIQEGFIKYEEAFLEEKFGDAYLDYKDRVYRWAGFRLE
jgi:protein-S-isoprenylcysteine O-methyltransferase Ste14